MTIDVLLHGLLIGHGRQNASAIIKHERITNR
ncbi:Uncharacterised protein [Vibrio cholerae]|nr:Uncharacterised protein [Vibrio cholerae]